MIRGADLQLGMAIFPSGPTARDTSSAPVLLYQSMACAALSKRQLRRDGVVALGNRALCFCHNNLLILNKTRILRRGRAIMAS
jgi:hypothetical protein